MCRTKMPLPHKKPPWKKIYAALPFVCKYCRGLFPDFKFYRRHIRSHESRYKKFWRSREWRAKRRYSTSYLDDIEDDGYAMDDDFYEATDLKKGKLLRRHSYDPDYLKKSGGRSGRSQGAVGKGPRGGYTPRGITVEQAALIAHYQRMQLSKHKAPERFEYDSEDNMEDDEHVSSYHDVIMRNVGALFIQQIEQCKCKDCFKTEDHINMQNGKDVLTSKQSIDGTVVSNKQHRRDVVIAQSRQAVRNKPLLPSDVNETQQENMPQMFAGNFPVSDDGKESGKLSPNVVTSASQTMLPCPHCPVSFDHADRLLLHIQNHYRLAKVQLAGASVAETPTKVNKHQQQLSQIQLQQLRQQQQLEQLQQLHIAHSRKATKVTATAAQNLPIVQRQIQQQQNHQIQQQQQQQRHSQQLQQQSQQQQQKHQSQQQQRHQSRDQRHQSQQQRHSQQQQHQSQQQKHQSQQQQTQRHQSQQQQQRHPSQQHQSQQQQQQRYQSRQQQQRHQSHQQQPHQHQKDQSHQQHQKQQVMQPREVSQIPHSMHHHQQPIKEPLIIQQQQQQRQQQIKKQVVSKHIDGQPIPQVQQQQWQQINQRHSHQRQDTMMQPTDTHQVNHQLKQIHDIYEPCIQTPSARASSVSAVTDSISVPSHLIPNNGSLNASNNNNSDTNSELPLSSADFKCSECDKAFVTEADLRVHLQYHQSPVAKDFRVRKHCFELVEDTQSQKPYSCSYCPKMFTYWSSLKTHEFTHTGNPPFACSVCDEKFTQSSDLKLHERTHFGANSFKCGKCGRLFKHRPSLTAHENSHHGEDGKNVCPVCLKNFSVGSNLRDHLRIHTGERPYECASCGRGFIQKSHLRKHVMIHTGERPFKCAYCSKGFTQRGDVRRHEKIHQKVK